MTSEQRKRLNEEAELWEERGRFDLADKCRRLARPTCVCGDPIDSNEYGEQDAGVHRPCAGLWSAERKAEYQRELRELGAKLRAKKAIL